MKKTHLEILAETYESYYKELLEQSFKLTEYLDTVIVWLVGFSTGAIAIILSSIDKLIFLNKSSIGFIVCCLGYSILSGVTGRIIYAVAMSIGFHLYASFNINLRMVSLTNQLDAVSENDSTQSNETSVLEASDKIQDIIFESFGLSKERFKNRKVKGNRLKGFFNRFLTYLSYVLYVVSAALFLIAIMFFIYKYNSK